MGKKHFSIFYFRQNIASFFAKRSHLNNHPTLSKIANDNHIHTLSITNATCKTLKRNPKQQVTHSKSSKINIHGEHAIPASDRSAIARSRMADCRTSVVICEVSSLLRRLFRVIISLYKIIIFLNRGLHSCLKFDG